MVATIVKTPHGQRHRARRSTTDLLHWRHTAELVSAYDALAPTYNQAALGETWMRDVLWRHYTRLYATGDRVLDVGCGTGLDAFFLARRGIRVTAIDISERMIAELEKAAAREHLKTRIKAQVAEASELGQWPGRYFHGIISVFGTLNTVYDLATFATDSSRLLLPHGCMVIHMLSQGGLWERLRYARRFGRKEAREHFRRGKRKLAVAGQPLAHRLLPGEETYRRYFSSHFRLCQAYGLGFLMPEARSRRLSPGVARLLGRTEILLGRFSPFFTWGRTFVLELENLA